MRVTIWNEFVAEREDEQARAVYPDGMHVELAGALEELLGDRVSTRAAVLADPEHGLTEAVLAETDVLLWWGHRAHEAVADEVVERVAERVLDGMGLVVLHSGHESKVFQRLMGTSCSLTWREADDRELVWTVAPAHPIASGVPHPIVLDRHEAYGEFFDIPAPDELVFVSSVSGGEVFRSGCCFARGHGRIFYFSPGHETFPIYRHPAIRKVIANAVEWVAPLAPARTGRDNYERETGWFEAAAAGVDGNG